MKANKATLEKITPNFGSSFTLRQFDEPSLDNKRFWHFHPEIEMVFIPSGNGTRHIGSHRSYFSKGDLVLIGANLPHSGFTDRLSGNQKETVIQFLPQSFGDGLFATPEMKNIKQLLERAKLGVSFGVDARKQVGKKINDLILLQPFTRMIQFLNILNTLALSEDYALLNVEQTSIETTAQDNERINEIYSYVMQNYKNHISLDEISDLVGLTPQSFSRYFKKITKKTFTEFVNEARLVHASKLLSEQPISITDVCFESGFNNFSHFSKLFKKFTGQTPSDYRNEMKKVIIAVDSEE